MTLPDFKGNFMPTMLPAQPETYVIEIEGGVVIRTPVIAWAPDADNPYRRPHPITLSGMARMVQGRAILFPGDMVDDPFSPVAFDNVEEWVAFVEAGGYASSKARRENTDGPVKKPTGMKTRDAEEVGPELRIEWMSKPFKTNSFYRYEADGSDFVFQIDGGDMPPKQAGPVTKIKRDEFMAFKKELDVATAEDLRNGVFPGMVEPFDDEDGEEEDDDDAASNLI